MPLGAPSLLSRRLSHSCGCERAARTFERGGGGAGLAARADPDGDTGEDAEGREGEGGGERDTGGGGASGTAGGAGFYGTELRRAVLHGGGALAGACGGAHGGDVDIAGGAGGSGASGNVGITAGANLHTQGGALSVSSSTLLRFVSFSVRSYV